VAVRDETKPGQHLDHAAVAAPNERAAAHYYPAIYWYSMLQMPPAKDFGGTTEIPQEITLERVGRRYNEELKRGGTAMTWEVPVLT
jgi:hypothetical protein